MTRLRSIAVFLGLVGCVPSVQASREPVRTIPGGFGITGGPSAQASSAAQATWNSLFDSPELRGLISEALAHNQELDIRLQEIIIASNEASARKGEYMPRVDAGVGVGIERVGEHTSQGVSDEFHDLPANLGDFSFGLTASWEVDIFKKLRNAAKAADLRYLASIEARNFLITQLVAEIARSYYEMGAIDAQLEVLTKTIELQTNALEVVKLQKQGARVTELAVQRFEAEVLKNRGRLFDLQQERVQSENRINFLVGRYPQPVQGDASKLKGPVVASVDVGVPQELLANRPDIRQAELELSATKLDVKSARAAFYPSLAVEAGLGFHTYNPLNWLATPASLVFGLAGRLTAPLVNRAALTAQYRTANAKQMQAVLVYERTVLQAFTDVATQLSVSEKLRNAYELQAKQVAALAQANDISLVLFQSARADYGEVLLTRRESLDAEMELIETRKKQLLAMVNMYQALGGGWRKAS